MAGANHLGFILAAYAAAAIIVGVLLAWVLFDYRVQRRTLADLERRGVSRRSDAESRQGAPALEAQQDA